MKSLTTLLVGALAASTHAFPPHMLQSFGVDEESLAKFAAVKRDPSEAERFLHENEERNAKPAVNLQNPLTHLLTHGGGLNGIINNLQSTTSTNSRTSQG